MRRILDGMTLEVLVERQREIDQKWAAEASAKDNNSSPAPLPA